MGLCGFQGRMFFEGASLSFMSKGIGSPFFSQSEGIATFSRLVEVMKKRNTLSLMQACTVPSRKSFLSRSIDQVSNISFTDTENQVRSHRKVKRQKLPSDTNVTISTVYESSTSKGSVTLEENKIEAVEGAIVSHSYVGLQLFYYLSLAYWKEGCTIESERTNLQHGRGSLSGFSAAHSCILPSVKDNYGEVLVNTILNEGVDQSLTKKLKTLGINESIIDSWKENGVDENELLKAFSKLDLTHLLNKKVPFYHAINSTADLPGEINQYDCFLEDSLRPQALKLLNEVSMGNMTPYEALEAFVEKKKVFLEESKAQVEAKLHLLDTMTFREQEFLGIETIQKSGAYSSSEVFLDQYLPKIYNFLKNYREITRLRKLSPRVYPNESFDTHQQVFDWIEESLENAIGTILKWNNPEDIKAFVFLFIDKKKHQEEDCEPLKQAYELLDQGFIDEAKQRIREVQEDLKENPPITSPMKWKNLQNQILKFVDNTEVRTPHYYEGIKQQLQETLVINKAQMKGNILPGYEQLSGKIVDGRRVGFSEEELFEQKCEVIQQPCSIC
jgi:hypothetical protein